jgi:hypothetical protein
MARAADPLALPAVPPPAPADHPRRDALVAAAFVLALAIAGAGAWSGRERSELAYEQRRAAPWPSWREAGGARAATAAFERAFGDRFAGRPALVRAHHATKAIGFGVSPVPKVMLGRDGWLYFLGEDARALDRHFRGTAPFDAAPEAVASEFARRHDALAARGIAYVVVVVPDKFSVYPEHLPGWVVRAAQTPLDRVSAAVSAQRRVRFLDLRAPLVAAKDGTPVYYLTDSHWNVRGAAIGYDALMREVQAALPGRVAGIVPVALPDYDPRTDRYSGDLANMLGLPRHFREPDRASFWKLLQAAPSRCARRLDAPASSDAIEAWGCDRAGLPDAWVLRDSMAIPLVPMLAENFRRATFVSTRALDLPAIEAARPDIVIEQLVERALGHALHHPVAAAAAR